MVKIFIGNIVDGARSTELKAMFEKYGPVSECSILTNFGFVHMDTDEDAHEAVKGLDGAFFAGSTIKVELSHGKNSRGGRGGRGMRGGFRGRGNYGGFRDARGRDRYDDYGRDRDYYGRADPYARDPYARDPYARDPYSRDPYSSRDPYERRPPPREDPYERRAIRDPYGSYSRDPYGGRDPYSSGGYGRDRSPLRREEYPVRRSYDTGGYERAGSPIGAGRRY
ncbi:RNA-binding protein lark-like isoform X2 [Watersipora subatra]|uniref:RNA-binding protein lark-like isoform X2 n=1 Tax=Watersipora subatra TaxID=2589382 RepID=UPI00355BA79A